MLSALHRLCYEDERTGKLIYLPLATEDCDPECEGKLLIKKGINVLVSKWSHSHSMWQKPIPWCPEDDKRKVYNKAYEGKRTLKDLSGKERQLLVKMIREECDIDELISVFDLRRYTAYQARHRSIKKKPRK